MQLKKFNKCIYQDVFKPRCNEKILVTENYCSAHKDLKCVSCGSKAVKSCPYNEKTVCCLPLCDNCVHYTSNGKKMGLDVLIHSHKK